MQCRRTRLFIVLIGTVLLAVLLTGCSATSPSIELSTTSFDFGDINPDEGVRTETFFVKNTGGSLLTITAISTSCGCTEAETESNNILPGEKTTLTVRYDPSVHPGLVGNIERVIYIKSNDPLREEIELNLIGYSLPSNSGDD